MLSNQHALLFSIFTNDLPFVLQEAKMKMYADDCRLYTSAPTARELTETLSKMTYRINWT
jgi:hypothetical protein